MTVAIVEIRISWALTLKNHSILTGNVTPIAAFPVKCLYNRFLRAGAWLRDTVAARATIINGVKSVMKLAMSVAIWLSKDVKFLSYIVLLFTPKSWPSVQSSCSELMLKRYEM
jgi:hypothetical protein